LRLSAKKKVMLGIIAIAVIALNILILTAKNTGSAEAVLTVEVSSDTSDDIQVFFTDELGKYSETSSTIAGYQPEMAAGEKAASLEFKCPSDAGFIRVDLGCAPAKWKLYGITAGYKDARDIIALDGADRTETNDIQSISYEDGVLEVITSGKDPYFVVPCTMPEINKIAAQENRGRTIALKAAFLVLIDGLAVLMIIFRRKVLSLPIEIYRNKKLILKLAVNDFKTKYAGSYLGIVWAFVQPVITILVYWFVFSVGFRSGTMDKVPFVLYLIAGLVPWFYCQDLLNSGTNALIEYSYLVKKVVFKISVLPMVKAISAFFVHAFFLFVTLVIYTCYGIYPSAYTIQLIYYFLCMFIFILGICYGTCAIVIFFRDLTQIINIVLQVGVWTIPIMWDINIIPEKFRIIFKINPMYYVVNGYRDSLYNQTWFWEHPENTLYFWAVTLVLFALGTYLFKKLKIHFADVL
jgi:teichoic acid transport system permease protein